MPIYFSFTFLVAYLLFSKVDNKRIRNVLLVILILGLFSGNFWVYPKKISQGWDSTLAHLPYYKLRTKMLKFIDINEIDKANIGYDFPGAYPQKYLDLSNETWRFPEANLLVHEYILYSSVVNDFTDKEIEELENNWEILHQENSITVDIILYKRKKL